MRRQILYFVVLSYLLSWSVWLLPVGSAGLSIYLRHVQFSLNIPWAAVTHLLGNLGPGLAAIILTAKDDGRAGVSTLLRRLMPLRASPQWYLLGILLPIGVVWFALSIQTWPVHYRPSPDSGAHWLRVFLINSPFGPLWEEIGWRGYLLSKLQLRQKGFTSAILVGVIWGPWHLPLYMSQKGVFLALFLIFSLGLSVILAWIYNATRESLAPPVLLHAATNATTISLLGAAMATAGMQPFALVTLILLAVGLGVLLFAGSDLACTRQ